MRPDSWRYWEAVGSGGSDEPQHLCPLADSWEKTLDHNAASIQVFQRIGATTHAAQPEMLNGMNVRRFLTDRMILVKTKQPALPIVKRHLAIRVCTDRKHETSSPTTSGKLPSFDGSHIASLLQFCSDPHHASRWLASRPRTWAALRIEAGIHGHSTQTDQASSA